MQVFVWYVCIEFCVRFGFVQEEVLIVVCIGVVGNEDFVGCDQVEDFVGVYEFDFFGVLIVIESQVGVFVVEDVFDVEVVVGGE